MENGLVGLAGAFLLLRAFSSGAAALTGVEAISNGVPNFRKPKSRNAATTLLLLGGIAASMLAGILFLASAHPGPSGPGPGHRAAARTASRSAAGYIQHPTISQLAETIFGDASIPFYIVVAATGTDPGLCQQHRLQRLPGAGLHPGRRRLPAAADAHPRRPAGLQQRHPRPGGGRAGPDPLVRRRRHPADPALHRGGLRILHGQPAGHDPALEPAAADHPDRPVAAAHPQVPDGEQHRAAA